MSSDMFPYPQPIDPAEAAAIREELRTTEDRFEKLRARKKYTADEWNAIAQACTPLRVALCAGTGVPYGVPDLGRQTLEEGSAELKRLLIDLEDLVDSNATRPQINATINALSEPERRLAREKIARIIELRYVLGNPNAPRRIHLIRPSDDALNAQYDSPEDVPEDVMTWVKQNLNVTTSDASDAVRWARIVDTLDDDRYPPGEVIIYRAAAGDEIRGGDWVSTSLEYVEAHLTRYLGGHGAILEMTVDGRDILESPTGNPEESIYAPREFSGPYEPRKVEDDDPEPAPGLPMKG